MALSDTVIKKVGDIMGMNVGKSAVERRLKALGQDLTTASRDDYLKVLDDIEKSTLTPMLGAGVAKEQIDKIRAVI